MADLEEVDGRQPSSDERSFDWRLGVTGQERRESAVPKGHDDRPVVDVALRKRRRSVGVGRIENLDLDRRIQHRPSPGTRQDDRHPGIGGIGHDPVECRIFEGDARMEDGADAEAIQHLHQPGHVILVRMAEHEQVDPSREERQVRAEPAERQLGIGAPVDQHRGAGR